MQTKNGPFQGQQIITEVVLPIVYAIDLSIIRNLPTNYMYNYLHYMYIW